MFALWVVAALVMRFGYLVAGPRAFTAPWFVGAGILVSSNWLGRKIATALGFPGEWTEEMLQAERERQELERASPVRSSKPLGAVGCVIALVAIAGAALVVWSLIH
jgi:hypothetical protein